MKMFSDRIEHSGKITLEALINSSLAGPKTVGVLGMGDKQSVSPVPVIEVKAEPEGDL